MASSFEVRLLDSGETYACDASESLLTGMSRLGRRDIPVGCRSGGCGVCRVQLVSGEIVRGRMSRAQITEADEKNGHLLACRAFPRSAVVVRVLGLKRNDPINRDSRPPGVGAAT